MADLLNPNATGLTLPATRPCKMPGEPPPPNPRAIRPPEPQATDQVPPPEIQPTQAVLAGCPNGCSAEQSGCSIKGNISMEGEKIYHLPGMSFYEKTKISSEYGERWFCSEEEALANGWRKALR